MNPFLNYKPSKYLLEKLSESNFIDSKKIIIRISDANLDNNEEIRKIVNEENYFIKILKTQIYKGKILPFESNNLLIEYVEVKHIPLKYFINKLSIDEANKIQFHLFAIILDLYDKYKFVHGNLSENNIYITKSEHSKELNNKYYFLGGIPLDDNIDLFIDETNDASLKKYNLVSDVIQIRKICLSLLKDKEIAFENDNEYKSIFEDFEIHVGKKLIKLEYNRIYMLTMKLYSYLRFK